MRMCFSHYFTMHKYNARARGIAGVSSEGRGMEGWWAGSHKPTQIQLDGKKQTLEENVKGWNFKKKKKKEWRACTR